MENIVAVSIKLDNTHEAIIYPSGTSSFVNLKPTSEGDLFFYKTHILNLHLFQKS